MSEHAWKFSQLKFPKPDLRVFQDMNKDLIERLNHATSGDDVIEIIFEQNELARKANDLLEAAFIRYCMDTTDEESEKMRVWANEHVPLYDKSSVEFAEAVYNSPFKEAIREKLGDRYFAKMDISREKYCEDNIPLMQEEAHLADEYTKLIASCNAEVAGEKRSFMVLQRLLEHEDREVRREAFKAFSKFLEENEEELEKIYDQLVSIRTQMAKNLGYDSYVPLGYLNRGRTEYGPEDVANFRCQVVEEIVPLCSQLYEAQAMRMGLSSLMVYDEGICFPDGNARPMGDEKRTLEQVCNAIRNLSPETDEFMDFMLTHELMDLENRPGKAAREYSTMLSSRKAPFMFAFFNGTARAVKVLFGEMGHAFACYRASRRQPIKEYYTSSADIMEIHVMTMTQFANRYAERIFGKDADKYRFYNLQDLMTFIPFGTAVDEFQHICYENPNLTPKERSLEWRKLEEKYMPWRKYDEDDEFMKRGGYWYHKQHIFLYPLYYIEYPFATINAMDMNRKYTQHPEVAWKEYLDLADLGGSKGYLDTLKTAGLVPVFEDGAVAKSISHVKSMLLDYISNE